ncbi:hypothetical protein [Pontibacter chinhatensis]|uniref:Uncharacterized protein n=1 Tax=Pontibacter chinhatensis TaxID=1436961 RepID=A0A1I2MJI7_9BACT|nr:hypothetical protein [Pontibacter chinhatensis]SFF90889.1 hypothetical protein SAMN05421739_101337 [Pontibacter chinhatensis]
MPFNDFFKRLLGRGKKLIRCSATERSARFQASYRNWLQHQTYLSWTGPFFTAYHYEKAGLPTPFQVELLCSDSLKGVVLFYDERIGADNFTFLFELLKDRVQQQGYTLRSGNKLECKEQHIEKLLLVPLPEDVPGTNLCNQRYGNVLLDYMHVHHKPDYIRLVVNTYQDPLFSRPSSFEELLEKVLRPEEERQK